jgi:hypothetical protein
VKKNKIIFNKIYNSKTNAKKKKHIYLFIINLALFCLELLPTMLASGITCNKYGVKLIISYARNDLSKKYAKIIIIIKYADSKIHYHKKKILKVITKDPTRLMKPINTQPSPKPPQQQTHIFPSLSSQKQPSCHPC